VAVTKNAQIVRIVRIDKKVNNLIIDFGIIRALLATMLVLLGFFQQN
jgi:uncharacterized membrane protein